jgi:hypothetical protein
MDQLRIQIEAVVAMAVPFATQVRDMGMEGTRTALSAQRWSASEDQRFVNRSEYKEMVSRDGRGRQQVLPSAPGTNVHRRGSRRRRRSSSTDEDRGDHQRRG